MVIGSAVPLISSTPAVAGCYPALASSDYGDMLKAGTSPHKAMRVVKSDNYDGTENCRIKFNMKFYKEHGIKPFDNARHAPSNRTKQVAAKNMSDTGLCWNWIKVHFPTGDVKKNCI